MPRRARLTLAGVPWHIIQRGNNRSACFVAESDYLVYLGLLKRLSVDSGCAIHAYVLMTNHVHLLLTPESSDSAALLMKHLGQRYVQFFNRTHHRSGTLWDGRFRSCLIQTERYLMTCYRYVELNPVRAGMVGHPRDYRWSSYHCNAEGQLDLLITPHPEYQSQDRDGIVRRACYRKLLATGVDRDQLDEIRLATTGNVALGDEQFQRGIEDELGRRARRGIPGRPRL